jgi:hypothetical protein
MVPANQFEVIPQQDPDHQQTHDPPVVVLLSMLTLKCRIIESLNEQKNAKQQNLLARKIVIRSKLSLMMIINLPMH